MMGQPRKLKFSDDWLIKKDKDDNQIESWCIKKNYTTALCTLCMSVISFEKKGPKV